MTAVSPDADTVIVQVTVGANTDIGQRRHTNEDSFLAEFPVFIVADGMGGHDAGDRASAAVIDSFRGFTGRRDVHPDEVIAAIADAHDRVSAIAETTSRGAGSTVTGVVCVRHGGVPRWFVINVGDSRVYRVAAEGLRQLTVDHSIAQQLVDQGRMTREEMREFRGRNVITRAIGPQRSSPDCWLLPIVTGERLLICSDGLTGELNDDEIQAGLMMGGAPGQTAHSLVTRAVQAGGRDNITAIVADVVSGGISADSDDLTGGLASTHESGTFDARTLPTRRRSARRDADG